MADRVTRSPVRLYSRDGKICYYRRLQYDLFLCLASFFFPSFPPSFLIRVCFSCSYCFVRAAAICSRQQARLCFLCNLCSALSQNSFCFVCFTFSFVFLVILGRRVCCALVSGALVVDLSTWLFRHYFVCFFSVSVCDHRVCITLGWRIRTDTGCAADVVR